MKTSLNTILTSEMQRLCVSAADRIRLTELISEVEGTLARYEHEHEDKTISPKQQIWERKLLDLSFRNNLLNMKVGKKVVPYMPCAVDVLEDLLADGNEHELKPEAIERQMLLSLYRTARTMMEESGANCLFLTLGTLKYDGHVAPLLLVPVDVVSAGKGRYVLKKRDEETMFNFTLVEFLKQNYGVEVLPFTTKEGELPTDGHGVDVSLIMHLVKGCIADQNEWVVVEDSYLGIFSFTKYVMWNDIHSHGQVLTTHPLLRSLVEGRLLIEDISDPADARRMDKDTKPQSIALPLPCDSSQIEAVADAANGRNFILYGPPGTGKSQTITNMIANAMCHGKRVLFVAQKKAALDVVENRLAKIGLGPFCLELHSNKVNKQHFLAQMDGLVQLWLNADAHDDESFRKTSEELFLRRQQLANYIEALQYKSSDDDLSIQECITQYASIDSNEEIVQKPVVTGLYSFSQKKEESIMSREELEAVVNSCLLMDAGERFLGMPSSEFPLAGLHPKASQRDLDKNLRQDLSQLMQVVINAEKQAESNINRKFMNKSAREFLEADYKWRHFSQFAQPDLSLLEDFEALKSAVLRWQSGVDLLDKWMKFLAPEETLRKYGLEDAIAFHDRGNSGAATAKAIRKGWLRKMAEKKIKENPVLSEFNSHIFEQTIEQYRNIAGEFESLTKTMVRQTLLSRLIECCNNKEFSSEMTLLRKRIASRGRGTTIRGIIDQMPHLLPAMAPCMLMSPLSVAQYIDIESEPFDIVVFDEASQMPTNEAVGSIARSKCVVVVGDPKQMPPTNFFATTTDDEEMEPEDLDSILDDSIALSMPSRYLSWHYRSQHESLIAFSNHNYYEGRLFTFPSSDSNVSHVTWQHMDGYYDFGKTRTNRAEAEAIVAEVESRLLSDSQDSIGIIAFSKQQSDLIEDILNEHLYANAEIDARASRLYEPLFVKNLENVQGDERDVILFSVGYGPDKDGKVSMNFGPLNKDGGERRLNVAVSRARKEMKVFSTLRPEQIDERRTQAEGVLGLKRFLTFAAIPSVSKTSTEEENKNHVITAIASKLKERGFQVAMNVGMSDMKIDIALADPESDGVYRLGIIFDGNNYQCMKTMRDREIVQPTVLKNLGWDIMHIWSVDCFINIDMVISDIIKRWQCL